MNLKASLVAVMLFICPFAAKAGAPSFSADLDTKAGRFSVWRADSLEGMVGCSFVLEIATTYSHTQWGPMAAITLRNEAEKKFVSLQFQPTKANSKTFRAAIRTSDGGSSKTTDTGYAIAIGAPTALSVRWDGPSVEFSADGKVIGTANPSFSVRSFELRCPLLR